MREKLEILLGGFVPSLLSIKSLEALSSPHPSLRVEKLIFCRGDGQIIRAFLTLPSHRTGKLPALLYAHAHGNRYEIGASELLEGRPALLDPPYGIALAKAGYVSLALDLPCFGERAGTSESAAAKHALWHGRTLFGEMLADLAGGFTYLMQRPEVDNTRIGMFGISMGATLTYWLGALEPRLKAIAHLLSFADIETLTHSKNHDLHGLYMVVPGLIGAVRTGEIAGLIAPRAQFAAMGACDPLTPPEAITRASADVRAAYAKTNAHHAFSSLVSEETGHCETPMMREAVMQFFNNTLQI